MLDLYGGGRGQIRLREMIATGGERYTASALACWPTSATTSAWRNATCRKTAFRAGIGKGACSSSATVRWVLAPYTMAYRALTCWNASRPFRRRWPGTHHHREVQHIQRIWLEEEANLGAVMHDRLEESA